MRFDGLGEAARASLRTMDLTDYHAKYIAHELTRRFPPDSAEKLAGRRGQRPGRPQPPPGRRRPVRVRLPALQGRPAGRRGRPRQDHRGRSGPVPALGGAQAPHPGHHPVEPAQAVVSGADREVLPALPHPGGQVLQRRDPAGPAPPLRGARDRHLLLPVRQGQGGGRSRHPPGTWW